MDQALIAYLAGIVDGEGSISLTKNNSSSKFRSVNLSVANTDEGLINFLLSTFGGNIIKRTTRKEHHRQAFVWQVRGDAAIRLLSLILPYLQTEVKRDRAELLVNTYKSATVRNGKYTPEQIAAKLDMERNFFAL